MMIAIIVLAYLIGSYLCFSMLRIEHEAEGQTYTKGNRLLNITVSLLSWLLIIVLLVTAWYKGIKALGYWDKPVKPKPE